MPAKKLAKTKGAKSKKRAKKNRGGTTEALDPSGPAPGRAQHLLEPDAAPGSDEREESGRDEAKVAAELDAEDREARSAGQAGSLEGLSDEAEGDSESVDELLEEGNAFEAGIIKGVENAPDADEQEVRVHEVPEDDVPEEYQDSEK